jgi:hypothetical protein
MYSVEIFTISQPMLGRKLLMWKNKLTFSFHSEWAKNMHFQRNIRDRSSKTAILTIMLIS